MARFTATWTNTTAGDWEAADKVNTDKIQVLGQDIEYIAQTHSHAGTGALGKKLALKDGVTILYLLGAG